MNIYGYSSHRLLKIVLTIKWCDGCTWPFKNLYSQIIGIKLTSWRIHTLVLVIMLLEKFSLLPSKSRMLPCHALTEGNCHLLRWLLGLGTTKSHSRPIKRSDRTSGFKSLATCRLASVLRTAFESLCQFKIFFWNNRKFLWRHHSMGKQLNSTMSWQRKSYLECFHIHKFHIIGIN